MGRSWANQRRMASGMTAPKRRSISNSLGRLSGNGTLGIETACSSPELLDLERCRERENRAAVLDCVAAPRRKTLPVTDPVDFIDDWHGRIARQKKIAMQRMRRASFNGAGRRDEGLRDHKPAEHALPANLRAAPAKNIFLDPFEIENSQKFFDGIRHGARDVLSGSLT